MERRGEVLLHCLHIRSESRQPNVELIVHFKYLLKVHGHCLRLHSQPLVCRYGNTIFAFHSNNGCPIVFKNRLRKERAEKGSGAHRKDHTTWTDILHKILHKAELCPCCVCIQTSAQHMHVRMYVYHELACPAHSVNANNHLKPSMHDRDFHPSFPHATLLSKYVGYCSNCWHHG